MSIVILHNPRCGKSRQTLKLLHEKSENVQVVEYLKVCPSFDTLKSIIGKTGLRPEELIRKNEKIYKEKYAGKELDDDGWIIAMTEDPILIQRPIVIKDERAIVARPPEEVEKIL